MVRVRALGAFGRNGIAQLVPWSEVLDGHSPGRGQYQQPVTSVDTNVLLIRGGTVGVVVGSLRRLASSIQQQRALATRNVADGYELPESMSQ